MKKIYKKALLTSASRYGMDSSAYKSTFNLWGKTVSSAINEVIAKNFTSSAIKIWLSTAGLAGAICAGALKGAVIGEAISGINYSPLKAAYNAANRAVPDKYFIINKHLSRANGNYAKFSFDSSEDIIRIVQTELKGNNVSFLPNPSGAHSWNVLVDVGTQIGTKGQSVIKVIIGYGGKIWTMFPI